jgi:hypothetical protein
MLVWGCIRLKVSHLVLLVALLAAGSCRVQSGYGLGAGDAGTTKSIPVGSEVRLVLSADYEWNLESTDTRALILKSTGSGSVGFAAVTIWSFDLKSSGRFVLRATGQPRCFRDVPPCTTASVIYEFTIISS